MTATKKNCIRIYRQVNDHVTFAQQVQKLKSFWKKYIDHFKWRKIQKLWLQNSKKNFLNLLRQNYQWCAMAALTDYVQSRSKFKHPYNNSTFIKKTIEKKIRKEKNKRMTQPCQRHCHDHRRSRSGRLDSTSV